MYNILSGNFCYSKPYYLRLPHSSWHHNMSYSLLRCIHNTYLHLLCRCNLYRLLRLPFLYSTSYLSKLLSLRNILRLQLLIRYNSLLYHPKYCCRLLPRRYSYLYNNMICNSLFLLPLYYYNNSFSK